jgi:hypothetical protein
MGIEVAGCGKQLTLPAEYAMDEAKTRVDKAGLDAYMLI